MQEIRYFGLFIEGEMYNIIVFFEKDVQIIVEYIRFVDIFGFKFGFGFDGGIFVFGKDRVKREGYVVY